MLVQPGQQWLFNFSGIVFMISIVPAIVLAVVLIVLRLRKSTPARLFRRWAVVTGVVWVMMIVAYCVMLNTFPVF
jgi:hypothetical protein